MKLTRSIMVVLLGLSLSAPKAHACELPGVEFFTWFYHICHPDSDNSPKESQRHDRSSGRDCHGGGGDPGPRPCPSILTQIVVALSFLYTATGRQSCSFLIGIKHVWLPVAFNVQPAPN